MLQPMQHLFLFSQRALLRALQDEGFGEISVDTAYKTLSADYLLGQIRPLNPLLGGALDALTWGVPPSMLRKYRRISIGEILAVGRRS